MDDFMEAISGPLADLLRAAADWLDSETEVEEAAQAPSAPQLVINDRGGVDST